MRRLPLLRRCGALALALAALLFPAAALAEDPSAVPTGQLTAEALFAAAEQPTCTPTERVCAAGRASLATSAYELRLKAAGCSIAAASASGCPAAADALARLQRLLAADRATAGDWNIDAQNADLSGAQVDNYIDKTVADVGHSGCNATGPICIAGQLVLWADLDQLTRLQPQCGADMTPEACLQERKPRMVRVDHMSTDFVKHLLDQIGWPDPRVWGEDVEDKAWLLVQHADDDPVFQHAALKLIGDAAAKGAATGRDYAYLDDRLLVHDNRPQEFGTQGTCVDGEFKARLIRDEADVDARRKSMGLGPLVDYERQGSQMCGGR